MIGQRILYVTSSTQCFKFKVRNNVIKSVVVLELMCNHEEADTRINVHIKHACDDNVQATIITNICEKTMCAVYGYPNEELVNKVRHKMFVSKTSDPTKLPPCQNNLVNTLKGQIIRLQYGENLLKNVLKSQVPMDMVGQNMKICYQYFRCPIHQHPKPSWS